MGSGLGLGALIQLVVWAFEGFFERAGGIGKPAGVYRVVLVLLVLLALISGSGVWYFYRQLDASTTRIAKQQDEVTNILKTMQASTIDFEKSMLLLSGRVTLNEERNQEHAHRLDRIEAHDDTQDKGIHELGERYGELASQLNNLEWAHPESRRFRKSNLIEETPRGAFLFDLDKYSENAIDGQQPGISGRK